MTVEIKTIDEAQDQIKKDLDHSKIDETESKSTDTAHTFLKEKADGAQKDAIQQKAETLLKKYDPEIKEGIIKHFDILGDDVNVQKTLDKIKSTDQITAYNNIIDKLDPKHQDSILTTIKDRLIKRNTIIENGIKDQKEKESQEKDAKLFELLSAEPTKERAELLFGDKGNEYKPAWEALFKHIENNEIKIADDPKGNYEKKEVMNANFKKLIQEYAGLKDGIYKDLTITLTPENKKTTPISKEFIKISYTIIKDGEGKPIEKKITKDIMFGNSTDVIHQERADHVTEKELTEFTEKFEISAKDGIAAIDERGAHITFKKMMDAKPAMMEDLLDKGLLKEINTFYTGGTGKDGENKENQYYSKITDIIVARAKSGDTIVLKKFLNSVDAQHLEYLGKDKTTQIANYNKLANVANDPNFKNNPVNQDIIGKILALQAQLGNANGIKESIEKSVDGFFKAYGKQIIGILEFFGGKGCVKKFFHSLGMDAFYEKNLKSIEDNINKIYKEKFELTADQKKGIDAVIGGKGEEKFGMTDIIKSADKDKNQKTIIDTAIDKFKDNTKTAGADKNGVVFAKQLKANISLLDPNLIQYLANKTFDKKDGDGLKDDGKALTINDYVFKDTTNKEWKLSDKFKTDTDLQDKIIARLLADKTTRETIKSANGKIEGIKTSKDGAKVEEYTRSDLGDRLDANGSLSPERRKYIIQTDQDIARYLTAYAFAGSKTLDYVITESGLTNNSKDITGDGETQKQVEIKFQDQEKLVDKNGEVTTEGAKKMIHEVINMKDNPPEKIVITHGGKDRIAVKKDGFTDKKVTAPTTTYVYEDDNKTRVQIIKGDIIKAKQPDVQTQTKQDVIENKNDVDPKTEAEKTFRANEKTLIDIITNEYTDNYTYTTDKNDYQDALLNMEEHLTSITNAPDNKTTGFVPFDNRDMTIAGGNLFGDTVKNINNLKNMFTALMSKGNITKKDGSTGVETKKDYSNKFTDAITYLDPKKYTYEQSINQNDKSIILTVKEAETDIGKITISKTKENLLSGTWDPVKKGA